MADDKQVDFVDGVTPVMAAWLDRMQEVEQGLAWNISLNISGSSLVLPAAINENSASLIIKGKMRVVVSPLSINFTGATSGTYGIWANTTSNDASPTFTIQEVLGTGAPAGVTFTRKIATVFWSGSALSSITLLAPYVKHANMHRAGGPDPMSAASVGTTELQDNSVTSSKIADNSVQPVDLADTLLQKPIVLLHFQPQDISNIVAQAGGSDPDNTFLQRLAPMHAIGTLEMLGRRSSSFQFPTQSFLLSVAATYMFPMLFPVLPGTTRQVRMRYAIIHGGRSGATGGTLTFGDVNYPVLTVTLGPSGNPQAWTQFQAVTAWANAADYGFSGATEHRHAFFGYTGHTAGVTTHWGLDHFVIEGRYSRA